jgi:hypothetical protein
MGSRDRSDDRVIPVGMVLRVYERCIEVSPMDGAADLEPDLLHALMPGEQLRARATDAVLAVTDRRLVVAAPKRIALEVPLGDVRRIQFDIERSCPATLVIVPESAHNEAQVLSIPPEHYQATAEALVVIGLELAQSGGGQTG